MMNDQVTLVILHMQGAVKGGKLINCSLAVIRNHASCLMRRKWAQ